jgi:hypothetical protein
MNKLIRPLCKTRNPRHEAIRKQRGAWHKDPAIIASIAKDRAYRHARHELYKQLAEEHLLANFTPGLIFNRTFEGYRGQRFLPHIEAALWEQVNAVYPPSGGA